MIRAATVVSIAIAILLGGTFATAEPLRIKLVVKGAATAQKNVPVRITIPVQVGGFASAREASVKPVGGGASWVAQLTKPSLLAPAVETPDGTVPRELHFVIPEIAAGAELALEATIDPTAPQTKPVFHWEDTPGKHCDLLFGDRPVLRYMYEALDEQGGKDRRAETMKVYHHLFDPSGKRLVTKGPGGLFPHHRGIFYGFNKITYGDKKQADVWHNNNGESQQHLSVLEEDVGPLLGRHRVEIGWHGRDGKVFATEQRELTAYNLPGGTLVEFASRLNTNVGPIQLAGDPQHAGFQFRASQDVPDKTAKLTYYVRPDGVGEPGKFRNWPADKSHVNLPWHALSFVLGEDRFTCCYLDRPTNPKESRFSERDYGRFGSYFEYQLTEEKPLELNYRLWLQPGAMTVEQVQAESEKFVSPATVTKAK